MLKTGDTKRRLGIMMMVLAMLVVGITATGYADPLAPTEQITGPAVVGTLTVRGNSTDVTVMVDFNGKCRGKDDNPVAFTGVSATLPTSLGSLTAGDLVGVRITKTGGASSECPLTNLIVKAVNPSTFVPVGSEIMAEVVLLFVVTP